MSIYQIQAIPDQDKCLVTVMCYSCRKTETYNVSYKAFCSWEQGELIQKALPQLDVDQRELLISNTCGKCFDIMFKDMEGINAPHPIR
jgi:hypothetical protein